MGGICVFGALLGRAGKSRERFELERSRSFNGLDLLYPAFLWGGPPLVVAGAVTGLLCLLSAGGSW